MPSSGREVWINKKLGQHWLRSEPTRDFIVQAAALNPADTVLEIGAGTGFLTEALVRNAGKVVAVEKDPRLVAQLGDRFAREIALGRLVLIPGDVLKLTTGHWRLLAAEYKLVANIPYYLTGRILRQFLTAAIQPSLMVLMLQKEVAERLVAKNRKESLLSVSVKAYGEPEYLKTVPPEAFAPPPKVNSAVLRIKDISRAKFADVAESNFFALLRSGFRHKRKMLKNVLKLSPENLERCTIKAAARAEELTFEQWLCLTRNSKTG